MKKTFILVAVAAMLFAGFAIAQPNPVWMRMDPGDPWEPAHSALWDGVTTTLSS